MSIDFSSANLIKNIEATTYHESMLFDGFESFSEVFAEYGIKGTVGDLLRDLKVSGHTFSKCIFKDFDLSRWDLTNCSFYGCGFVNCLFPKNLKQITFNKSELVNIDLTKRSLESIDIFGSRFHKVIFAHAGISSCQCTETIFDDCNLEHVVQNRKNVFIKCSFTHINMTHCSIPRIHLLECQKFEEVDLSYSDLSSAILEGINVGVEYKVKFDYANLTTANIENSHIKKGAFSNTFFDRTLFSGSEFSDLEFRDQNFEKVWFDGCKLQNCAFMNCNLYASKLNEAILSNVLFDHVNAGALFAQRATFKGCNFNQCLLNYADFSYTQLLGCNFDNCNLDQVTEHDLKLEQSYYHSCSRKLVNGIDQDLFEAEHFL